MTAKDIQFDETSAKALLRGIEKISRAVKVTLGPGGRNVVIERTHSSPLITKDGVTVAKSIDLPDPFENIGAQLVCEAASRTMHSVGDGTTTATVLTEAIFREGFKYIISGGSPLGLQRGMTKAVKEVAAELSRIARPVVTHAEIQQVATVAANGDADLGKIIADALEIVGKDGSVSVDEAKGLETTLELVEGLQIDRGFLSAHFITDPESGSATLENALVLVHQEKISSASHLLPLLAKVSETGRPFFIVAEDVEGEALSMLVVNKLRGHFSVAAIKAPGFGDQRKEWLEDIAALTGALVVTADLGRKLDSVTLADLGNTRRVVVTADSSTIIGGEDTPAIEERRKQLLKRLLYDDSTAERDKVQQHLARLAGRMMLIHVGAATETEMEEKKARVDDALLASRAALAEGVIPGGGIGLLRAQSALDSLALDTDERMGALIIRQALEIPLRQLVDNAGGPGKYVVQQAKALQGDMGYNVATGQFEDLMAAGIIDPVKVTRIALESAASIASLLLSTTAVVADRKEASQAG